ncbi:hypothetical protein RESH_02710 [Rhodopirellula europaea SH398]|uniref:Uncharacterized protein n=1 Tax=Rhodopirellula europaea SH398 TaxID=1263868 RepID=M5SGJ6_9BACT|nr:hypothetical protein RESH_02710 [Rhodopirellula europaea SH398]
MLVRFLVCLHVERRCKAMRMVLLAGALLGLVGEGAFFFGIGLADV